jgi:hypothetical protein
LGTVEQHFQHDPALQSGQCCTDAEMRTLPEGEMTFSVRSV